MRDKTGNKGFGILILTIGNRLFSSKTPLRQVMWPQKMKKISPIRSKIKLSEFKKKRFEEKYHSAEKKDDEFIKKPKEKTLKKSGFNSESNRKSIAVSNKKRVNQNIEGKNYKKK